MTILLPAHPSVSDVQITGEVVEGSTIKGVGKYFGGREGPSKFDWLREDKNSGLVFHLNSLLPCSDVELDQMVISQYAALTILLILLFFKDT